MHCVAPPYGLTVQYIMSPGSHSAWLSGCLSMPSMPSSVSSNTFGNTSTPVKPTAAYTSREPYYTLNPATPAPTRPFPVIAGAEFVRPSDEEIAELKEAYEAEFQELDYDERMYLRQHRTKTKQ